MAGLTAFAALLARAANQEDIVVGSPIAGRVRREIEGLIGFFVNTLALRADLVGGPSFRQALARVRRTALDADAHQHLPFERLVEELAPERNMGTTPIFQAAFALQNAPRQVFELPGLTLSALPGEGGTAKFDLTLILEELAAGLRGMLEYKTELFDGTSVARLAAHFERLVEGAVADPDRPLAEVPLLSDGARQQIVREWNATAGPWPEDASLHGLFERQAERSPDAVAAWFEAAGITYGELCRRAGKLAAHLVRSLPPGAYVALCMERSLDMLVGLLGTLQAGLAYVPLEPGWPAERKRWILASLEVRCALTGTSQLRAMQELQWQLPALSELVVLDAGERRPPAEPVMGEAVRELWDEVAERAVDRVTAGGFLSSYTGLPFAEAEVDEYRDRVVKLASPWLRPGARVLEIGSGSGLILFEIAPRVARYVGLDPSALTQERSRRLAAERGLGHVELPTAFAHELEAAGDGPFDLVILASTVHFFPGPLYLERVLQAAFARLAPGGAVLVADVPDLRRREELRASLDAFRAAHRGEEGLRTRSRFDELYLDEDLFRDLAAELPAIVGGGIGVEVLHRQEGFDNELRFRYDVLLRAPVAGETAREPQPARRKEIRTLWHLDGPGAPAGGQALPAVPPDAFAYVIFTSGSTGTPKGVVVRHRPAVHLVDWVNRTFGVGPRDRVLFLTSPCFDLSVYDIFGLLAAGGSLRVASESDLRDPERLVDWLVDDAVTFWDSAPAALQQLVPFLTPAPPTTAGRALRLVFLSGDWIPLRLPESVRQSFPAARVIGLGGATEATVWSNFFPVGAVDPAWASIPYGRPVRNAGYFVLDPRLEPCPVGVAGDLYIGGECLASGYAGEPALTAAKFLPDPWSHDEMGGRLYRTGDLARFFADGNIEFLGRADQQVKIRGFRVELGEIEAALVRHPAVREAVVVAHGTPPGDRRLAAYVVADVVPAAELKTWLQERLTDAMVPSAFVFLEAMPVTANGKLDRRALPDPQLGRAREGVEHVEPRTATERRIAAIWGEVLGLDRVGAQDNFFELGGHSLLATQAASRIARSFDVRLPVRDLFAFPILEALAERVDELLLDTAGDDELDALLDLLEAEEMSGEVKEMVR
jgi:amino acid adenylation domain-containing protein